MGTGVKLLWRETPRATIGMVATRFLAIHHFLKGACNTVTYSYQSCYNIMILKMFGLDLGDSRSRVSNG